MNIAGGAFYVIAQGVAVARETTGFLNQLPPEDESLGAVQAQTYGPTVILSAQKVVNVFENLRGSAGTKDWPQIIRNCAHINEYWLMCMRDEFEVGS